MISEATGEITTDDFSADWGVRRRERRQRALGSTERITRLLNELAQPVIAQVQDIVVQKVRFDLLPLIHEITANSSLLHQHADIRVSQDQEDVWVFARLNKISLFLARKNIKPLHNARPCRSDH